MGKLLSLILIFLWGSVAAMPPQYAIHDLTAQAGAEITVSKLNDAGQLIGLKTQADGSTRGYLYSDGEFHDFGALVGDSKNYEPRALNNLGEVVLANGSQFWLYHDGQIELLGIPGNAIVNAMNDHGAIVGEMDALGEASNGSPRIYREAFIYIEGEFTLIVQPPLYAPGEYDFPESGGYQGYSKSWATDINNNGSVAGVLDHHHEGNYDQGFFYRDGEMQSVPSPGNHIARRPGQPVPTTNNNDAFTATFYDPWPVGVIWENGITQAKLCNGGAIGYPGSRCEEIGIFDLNDQNTGVGELELEYRLDGEDFEILAAYIRIGSELYILQDLLAQPDSVPELRSARFINSSNTVVATRVMPDDSTRFFLLNEVVPVVINIKPWDKQNRVSPESNGIIIVMVASASTGQGDASDFDATQINPMTVRMGPGQGANIFRPILKDGDRDGLTDAILGFRTKETGIYCGDTQASVTGQTWAGEQFIGTDSIQTENCMTNSCHPR
jgi:probable HAF family extracellular repeat protein